MLNEYQELKKQYNKVVRANLKIGQENCRLNELVKKQFNNLIKLETFVEIIKDKEVVIAILIRSNTLDDYNNNPMFVSKLLTQEEYDLLKEVLLWD